MSGRKSPKTTFASAAAEDAPEYVRVRMAQSRQVPVGKGTMQYMRGELYHVPAELAAAWLEEDVAVDSTQPPKCEHCGAEAESRALLARHIAANHPTPAGAAPPAAMLKCPHCSMYAESQELLDRHVAANHPPAPAAPASEEG